MITDKQLAGMFSSRIDDWETPIEFFRTLDAEFHFDLDPCADDQNHKCPTYFTREQNGLSKNWGGTGFSVILPMGEKSVNGYRSPTKKAGNPEHWS